MDMGNISVIEEFCICSIFTLNNKLTAKARYTLPVYTGRKYG